MFQKLANSEGVGLQIEKILDDFTWKDPILKFRCVNISQIFHTFVFCFKRSFPIQRRIETFQFSQDNQIVSFLTCIVFIENQFSDMRFRFISLFQS